MNLRHLQQAAWNNKRSKGFNTTEVPLELCLIQTEIVELFQSWRLRETSNIGSEVADIAIYVAGLAEMLGVDLEDEVTKKLAENSRREYVNNDGVLCKRSMGSESLVLLRPGKPLAAAHQ